MHFVKSKDFEANRSSMFRQGQALSPPPKLKKQSKPVLLGPGDTIGQGESSVIYTTPGYFTPASRTSSSFDIFETLKADTPWQIAHHQGGALPRLVSVQGSLLLTKDFDQPSHAWKPLYRHPTDKSPPLQPYTPLLSHIALQASKLIGNQPLNHCLLQLYRTGEDFISEHADKTLDISRGSSIVNVSFGAERCMRLRTKRMTRHVSEEDKTETRAGNDPCESQPQPPERRSQFVPLPHASLFVLGPSTNTLWLHSIPANKKPLHQQSDAERAYAGERISLTFRHIDTFLSEDETLIWVGLRPSSSCWPFAFEESQSGYSRHILAPSSANAQVGPRRYC